MSTVFLHPKTVLDSSNLLRRNLLTTYFSLVRFSTRSSRLSNSLSSSCEPSLLADAQYNNVEDTGESEQSLTLSITPKTLKAHLDQYVIGQERAKKMLSVAVFNHYQRTHTYYQREEEKARQDRRARPPTLKVKTSSTISDLDPFHYDEDEVDMPSVKTSSSTSGIDKANILLLGPSGVGKTLMAKTLASVLSVPFSISDCTPFTQAGYIGEDAEACVHRLLAAAKYDVAAAERGIICLDEIDKIATTKASHGRDVSGEGVQQALLKIIEGTTVQVQQKNAQAMPPKVQTGQSMQPPMPPRTEVHTVRTDNILFICSGAFVGLEKIVMDRVSRASIGFGQPVRSSSITTDFHSPRLDLPKSQMGVLAPLLPGSEEESLYKAHLPFFNEETPLEFNPLDLATLQDLQRFGFIPELIGRIPNMVSVTPLNLQLLLQILTEPRNCLVAQYIRLFSLADIELRFTTPGLYAIARNALIRNKSTGARALRTEMESVLGDAMFEAPGSDVAYVLVTERVANRKEKVACFTRGDGRNRFESAFEKEEKGER